MKISKLFHWLYGFLMLLPVFAVGVRCLYVIFNKNAKDSYTGAYAYNTTNTISQITPLTSDNVEKYEDSYTKSKVTSSILQNELFINLLNSTNDTVLLFSSNHVELPNQDLSDYSYDYVFYGRHNGTNVGRINIRLFSGIFNYDNSSIDWQYGGVNLLNSNLTEVANFMYERNTDVAINLLNNSNVVYQYSLTNVLNLNFLNNTVITTYFVDVNLSSVFYASLQELDDTTFFGWARDSFIAKPFLYIGNLFGISSVHPIFTFLSYWLSISIIWLVFDLIMYVPLLVHRWLDKGVLE